jgi:hypothetical protein
MFKKQVSIFILSSIAICAIATPSPAFSYGGTGWGPLTMVTIYRGTVRTGALIKPSVTFTNGDGCSQSADLMIDFSTAEAPDGKALYATALAAHLAGKSVSIGTLGCSSEGFPLVYGINVQP